MRYKYHQPVLLEESIEYLRIDPSGIYVDATLGGGGHTREIYKKLNSNGVIICFDQDIDAIEHFKQEETPENIILIHDNFSRISERLEQTNYLPIDGILFDLGISSYQIDHPEKGFTFQSNEARLNMNLGLSDTTAEEVINRYTQEQLQKIFKEYGELKQASRLSKNIVAARKANSLKTTGDLKNAISGVFPSEKQNKILAKIFQAIRIEVNDELRILEHSLENILGLVAPGGRIVVISYHSLEDRIVKRFIQKHIRECLCPPNIPICQCGHHASLESITSKPITPGTNEINLNIRARSAKMRVAQKKEVNDEILSQSQK